MPVTRYAHREVPGFQDFRAMIPPVPLGACLLVWLGLITAECVADPHECISMGLPVLVRVDLQGHREPGMPGDRTRSRDPVDVAPAEAEDFPAAQPVQQQEDECRVERIVPRTTRVVG
jgi:hypothetical protein